MPTIALSVSLGEILLLAAACVLGGMLYLFCRSVRGGSPRSTAATGDVTFPEQADLVSKLAVIVSMIIRHADTRQARGEHHDPQLLDQLRESCLAVVETTWLRDIENAYDESRKRRIAAYKRSRTVAELRERIANEDLRLRREIQAVSEQLEQVLDSTNGRYARASERLTSALERMLRSSG
jgi:hypothetical protein